MQRDNEDFLCASFQLTSVKPRHPPKTKLLPLELLSLFVELIPTAVTQLGPAEFFPIVALLFSAHADRLSPANNAADNRSLLWNKKSLNRGR